MRLHVVIPLIAAIANLLIGTLVLRRGWRNPVLRVFAWMTFTIVIWNVDIFCLYLIEDAAAADWWSRVFRTGICFAPTAVLHTAVVMTDARGSAWRWLLRFGYASGAVLAVINLSGGLVSGLSRHAWGWYPQPTPLYGALTFLLLGYGVLTLERIIYAYRFPSTPRQRLQAKFWFLAGILQVPFSLTNLLPMYNVDVLPLGNLGNVVYVGIVAYAMARHRLMDVDYVVRKVVSFAFAAGIVLIPGALAFEGLGLLVGQDAPLLLTIAAVGLALTSVLLVPTLQEAIESRLDRAFFPERYGSRQRLRELGSTLVHLLEQPALVHRLGSELGDVLALETVDIFMMDDQGKRLTLAYPTPDTPEALPDGLTPGLDRIERATLTSELEAAQNPLAILFHAQGWEVGIPLRIQQRLMGFVGLGQRRDLRIFSAEDLQLLDTVAAGASVALENANLSHQLRRSEAVLEQANRLSSVGMLAAGIAHEIRNPLVAVKTFLDLLPHRLDDPEFLSKFRDLSLSELRRVTDLIKDLLSFGKSTKAERRAVDAAETLEPVVRLMQSTALKRGIELTCDLSPDLPALWADPDQLKQIILNLLLNAIEASPADTRVSLSARGGLGRVTLAVADQGSGIPKEQLDDIFHPFFTTKETGTGLGLALVHQMVIDHGGEITVESRIGRGTTFRVSLPTAQALARTGT